MSKVEVITSVERRRKWSQDQKEEIVKASYQPDVNISQLARKHKIEPSQIYIWRKEQLPKTSQVAQFRPIMNSQDNESRLKERIAVLERVIAKAFIEEKIAQLNDF